VTQVERNIPDGTVALEEGARVLTAEGRNAGKVERVLADGGAECVTHLLVSTGMLTKEKKLVPINWVTTIGEHEIHLRVEKHALEALTDASIAIERK
jgi:uncharacterized protein YrrD